MALKFRQKLLLAKIEAVSGTAQPLTAADAILASNVELNELAGDTVSREIERPYYGNPGDIPINVHMTLSFNVELASSGGAGTAPAWGKLLKACAMAETITAVTKTVYNPITGAEQSITLGLNIAGQLFTMPGARGTWAITGGSNRIQYLNFTFTGKFTEPSSTTQVKNPVYTAFKDPLIGSNTNTPIFEFLGNDDLGLTEFTYTHAAEVVHREVINVDPEVLVSGRSPTFSMVIDQPAYATLNLASKARGTETGALKIVHGKAAGEIIQIDLPKTQISSLGNQEADGIWQKSVGLSVLPNTGNDEISLEVR